MPEPSLVQENKQIVPRKINNCKVGPNKKRKPMIYSTIYKGISRHTSQNYHLDYHAQADNISKSLGPWHLHSEEKEADLY